jgi:hypothetical protein
MSEPPFDQELALSLAEAAMENWQSRALKAEASLAVLKAGVQKEINALRVTAAAASKPLEWGSGIDWRASVAYKAEAIEATMLADTLAALLPPEQS